MKKHVINVDDVKEFTSEIELAGSYGRGENKSLMACATWVSKEISFKVINDGEVIAVENDLEKAIDIYNEL